MSFEEKSTWAMIVAMLLVYGWYFFVVSAALPADLSRVSELEYRQWILGTVIALIVIVAIAHAAIAFSGSESADERDREINRHGETVGGYIAGAGAVFGLGLAIFEQQHFWIANTLLLFLVLSELVSGSLKIFFYRRGF